MDEDSWREARRELAAGKLADAWDKLQELLERYPEEAQLLQVVGLAALKRGEREAALAHVRKAVALAPDDVEALTLLGWLDMEVAGDVETAIESYRKAAALKPDVPEVHNNLGVALKRNRDLEPAVGSFSRALELNPDFAQATSNRGWAYVDLGKWQEARTDFEKSLVLQPTDEAALYGLARVRKELRDYSGAQEALTRLSGQSGNFVYWLEWAVVGLVRYYWVFLLLVLGLFFYYRYKARRRVKVDG
ncbi:MAG: tetratricopeptide repeat protein [Deltaproteobacteria bacterium]|nr:tetratricopeptide repeat protein [Deltaproteobacteria bacterium]